MVIERFTKKLRVERAKVYQASRVIIGKKGVRSFRREGSFIRSLYKELPRVGNPKLILQIDCEPK